MRGKESQWWKRKREGERAEIETNRPGKEKWPKGTSGRDESTTFTCCCCCFTREPGVLSAATMLRRHTFNRYTLLSFRCCLWHWNNTTHYPIPRLPDGLSNLPIFHVLIRLFNCFETTPRPIHLNWFSIDCILLIFKSFLTICLNSTVAIGFPHWYKAICPDARFRNTYISK